MRLHRFYVPQQHNKWGPIELTHNVWLHDERLLNQWLRVLRYQPGDELVLFNEQTERQYRLLEISADGAHVELVTERERQVPAVDVYLLFSLLKKEKNEWVLQKATELGVSHFVPILSERTEKTGFDDERARMIVIEAAEQCGRSDLPMVREPIGLEAAMHEFNGKMPLLVAEQGGEGFTFENGGEHKREVAVLIGPEGGWSEAEKSAFEAVGLPHLGLGNFTLRAETAALVAAATLSSAGHAD